MLLPNFSKHIETLGYQRRWFATLLALQIGATVFEALGVASIVPILDFINTSGTPEKAAQSSRSWAILLDTTRAVGLPVSFGLILVFAYAAILVRQVFMYVQSVYSAFVINQLILTLRKRGLQAFFSAGEQYRSSSANGEIANDLTVELQNAASCLTAGVRTIGFSIMLVGYVVVMFLLSPSLSLAAIGITGVVAVSLAYVTRRIRVIGRDVVQANQNVLGFLIERLATARLVRLSGTERPEIETFTAFLDTQRRRINALQKVLALFSVSLEPIVLIFGFVLLYFSVTRSILDPASLILFFFILLRMLPIAKEVALCRQAYIASLGSVETLSRRMQALEAAREIDDGHRSLTHLEKGIEFKNVSYSYRDGTRALDGVSLTFPAGRMSAIVGPSGAGKSTLVDLIPRLYAVEAGQILIDGVPQEEFSIHSLRQAISFAPQRPQLFDVSIEDHIRYGKPDASDKEVRRAAELAQAIDFIEAMPEGFKSPVGNNGHRLSGGQRQRVDLARAIVRGAPILLLDEPTSSLDEESAREFLGALHRIRRETDTTVIVIGHNLAAMEDADHIVVMNGGRVEATGRHDELMQRECWYRRMRLEDQRTLLTPATAPALPV